MAVGLPRVVVDHKYTYETDIEDLQIGDTVVLPCPPYDTDETWQGKITALESDYDGDCVMILAKLDQNFN